MNKTAARQLRENLTDAEKVLWKNLRSKQINHDKFRRQSPIGKYIVDFVCFEKKLIVELDGGQHSIESDYEAERTRWLESQGFQILRFWNHEALNSTNIVLEEIAKFLIPPP